MHIVFHGIKLEMETGFYANGQRLIQFWQGGAPYMTASVALDIPKNLIPAIALDYQVDPDQIVFIKNWSENEDIFQALCDAEVIYSYGHYVPTGYVRANVAVLNPQ
jgi:hypothetical protein